MRTTLQKVAAGAAGVVLLAAAGAVLLLYLDNQRNIEVANQMMDDAASLEIGHSGLSEVRAFGAKYHASLSGKRQQVSPCVEADCLVVASVPREEFMQHYPKVSNWLAPILRRRWNYSVFMWVENGRLTAQSHWFVYATPKRNLAVIADITPPHGNLCQDESYRLHHEFAVYFAPHHFEVWVDPSKQGKQLARFHFGCVNSFAGCSAVSEVVPAAWQRYQSDQEAITSGTGQLPNATCP